MDVHQFDKEKIANMYPCFFVQVRTSDNSFEKRSREWFGRHVGDIFVKLLFEGVACLACSAGCPHKFGESCFEAGSLFRNRSGRSYYVVPCLELKRKRTLDPVDSSSELCQRSGFRLRRLGSLQFINTR